MNRRMALLTAMGVALGCGGSADRVETTNEKAIRPVRDTAQPVGYTVGGTISGLHGGTSLVLQNNGADDLSAVADGPFTFATALASGSTYKVTVHIQPWGQECLVTNASGTIAGADVTNVNVSCSRTTGGGQGYCVYTLARKRLTGKCMSLWCEYGPSVDCLGPPVPPIVTGTFCGPRVDRTPCMF
jgi:hypothetical protein